MSLTLDDNTYASHPGVTKISKNKFLLYHNLSGIKKMVYLILLTISKRKLIKLFPSNEVIHKWISISEQFEYGCICPTVIINKEKGLVATYTDLDNTDSHFPTPVIKITKQKLNLVKNILLENGQRVCSVAVYYNDISNKDAKHWKDFSPLLIDCFTDNPNDQEKAMQQLNGNAWKCLELGLEQIADKHTEGLYFVDLPKKLIHNS